MKMGRYAVSFPVYRLNSDVTYQTVRMPTVFERMVLRLVAGYHDLPGVATLTMGNLFEDRLGVQDAPALVSACIKNLQALDVLDWPPCADALQLPIQRFWLTPSGQDFQRRDRLPVNPRTVAVSHLYFPLEALVRPEEVNDRTRTRLADQSGALQLGERVLRPANDFAAGLVRQGLGGETYDWKSRNAEIREVQSQVKAVLWETHVLELSCDASGALSLDAPTSPKLKQWLAHATPETIWEHLLSPMLTRDSETEAVRLSGISPGEVFRLQPAGKVERIPESGEKDPVASLRVVPASNQPSPAFPGPLLILGDSVAVSRLPDDAGSLRVMLPTPAGIPAGFAGLILSKQGRQPSAELSGTLTMFWAGQPRDCAVRLALNADRSREVWSIVTSTMKPVLSSQSDPMLKALPILWQPPGPVVESWRHSLSETGFKDVLSAASGFAEALKALAASTRQEWEPVWHEGLANQLEEAAAGMQGGQGADALIPLLGAVRLLLPAVVAVRLQSTLLGHAAPLASLKALADMRAALLPSVPVPETLIADSVLQTCVQEVLIGDGAQWADIPGAGAVLTRLRDAAAAIRREIGEAVLSAAAEGRIEWRGLSSRALDTVRQWREVRAALAAYRPKAALTGVDAFRAFDLRVDGWSSLAQERLAPPCAPTQRLVIIDTSALMARPELLQTMPSRDVPVLPRKVLEELDGLKQGGEEDERARTARRVVRAIESRQDLRFESADPGLLPADWEESADNLILSVALRLRLSDVLLLSADKNLRNKARSEQINVLGPEEYLVSRPKTPGGNNNHKNQKRRK